MAFTKINAAGIGSTETVTLDGLSVINNGSFGGNLTVGGVLTYEDVTNVDSVGLITARNGIVVGSGITLSKDGDIFATGVTTTGSLVSSGAISGTTGNFSSNVDVAGELTVAETIAHTGDTNNKISFPSADTIALTTAGSERFKIDSSGNVTIGNDGDSGSNPSSGYDELCIEGGNEAIGMCFLSPAANDVEQTIAFGDSNNNQSGKIQYEHANDAMHFDTAGSERVRINSSGYMGIGENSPSNLLHVKVSDTGVTPHSSAQIVLERSGTNYLQFLTANDGTSGLLFGDADDNDVAQIKYDHNVPAMQFLTETGERLRIDAYGRILIGTTSTVIASSNDFAEIVLGGRLKGAGITLQDVDSNVRFQIRTDDDASGTLGTLLNASTNHDIFFRTNNTERLRIDKSGRILIGTTTAVGSNTPNLQVLAQSPASGFDNHIYLEGNETSGAADTGATIGFGGHDGQTARNWAQIAGFKANGTSGNTSSFLSFRTRRSGVSGINEMFKITAMGSFLARDSKESAIGREWTNGSVPAGQTRDSSDNGRLNFNSIGGNGGGHITCLSVSSFDQNPSGAMIIAGVHGQGFNTYDTIVSNFDSGISVTFSGGTVTIQNTSSETIYYSVNVIHMGTGNTTYLGR